MTPPAWLVGVPAEVISRLNNDSVRMSFSDNSIIHARGDKRPGLSMIISGQVRFGTTGMSGNFIQFGLMGPGAVFGEMSIFTLRGRLHDAIAVGPVIVDQLSGDRLLPIIEEYPVLQMAFLRLMAARLQFAYENIDSIIRSPLVDRIGGQLLSASRLHPDIQIMELLQSELAESLGASRVAVNKALAQLAALGFLTTGYRNVTLHDRAALRAWLDQRRDVARL